MRWLGSWLVGSDGREAAWFYSGFGSESTQHVVPADATGVRIRRWVSEGLDPEWLDLPCEGEAEIATAVLDFDAPRAPAAAVTGANDDPAN